MKHSLILINPWIYDFAAYDLWSKPLGLLYIAGYLRKLGFDVHVVDCLDVYNRGMLDSSDMTPPVRRSYGTGKFWRKRIKNPEALKLIPRTYSRYGITSELFIDELRKAQNPSAILVTSLMTYWYPGVFEVINLAKEIFPHVPIILGGIYAKLCHEHAVKYSNADYVSREANLSNMNSIINILESFGIYAPEKDSSGKELPFPAFDLINNPGYACILTSTGCPYHCKYCASSYLNPVYSRRNPDAVVDEIVFWNRELEIKDFAFYDDALLVDSGNHMRLILENIIKENLNVRFHTPNALHVREISSEMASLMKKAGFKTMRLGLETSDIEQHRALDNKICEGEFEGALKNLKQAGFPSEDIGVYILIGLPGQSIESIQNTLRFVANARVTPFLAEYSPLPNTPLWGMATASSEYDLASEPLFHNNSLLPCWDEEKRKRVSELKNMVREIRQGLN